MKRTLTNEQGMSLVEATIILLVLMILTSVLAPSIYDFVSDAKMVKVKEDCEAIGISVVRLTHDVGPCMQLTSAACTGTNRLDVLYSRGTAASLDSTVAPGWTTPAPVVGDMEEQFTTNTHVAALVYPLPVWRGAYLSAPIGPDPWGSKYAVNVKFLGEAAMPNPLVAGAGDTDVFCLSAGPNKKIETAFAGNGFGGTTRGGDDFVYVIGGSQYSHQ
jgi:type II secretory pathway pseudopilin PulG